MTTIRTDLIPNLYANPISTISKANTAVVTVPTVATVVSTTGTIGTVTGSGNTTVPWTAPVTLMTAVTGLKSGDIITSTANTGSFAAGGVVSVKTVDGNQSITINKIGGNVPTAGIVFNITLPAISTLPTFIANGDPILFTNPGNKLTFSSVTGEFVAGETISQPTSLATGVVTNVLPTAIQYIATANVFNTANVVTGATSNATTTPTAVTGMNQLLTGGLTNNNQYYYKNLTPTTFELYVDSALTVPLNTSSFTTYTTSAGQYTTTDTVLITTP